jgi:uncharacterized protein
MKQLSKIGLLVFVCFHGLVPATTPRWPIGSTEVIHVLSMPIDMKWRDPKGRTQLFYFVALASQSKAIAYLERQKSRAPRMEDNKRLLLLAVNHEAINVVRWLLLHGESPNAIGEEEPPLTLAIGQRRLEMAQLLLDHGAKVNIPKRNGWTTMAFSELHRGNDLGFYFLLRNGLELQRENVDGPDNLLLAAAHGDSYSAVKYLVSAGFKTSVRSASGNTPLIIAAMNGSGDAVAALLESGADPCLRGFDGKRAVDYVQILAESSFGIGTRALRDVKCPIGG